MPCVNIAMCYNIVTPIMLRQCEACAITASWEKVCYMYLHSVPIVV